MANPRWPVRLAGVCLLGGCAIAPPGPSDDCPGPAECVAADQPDGSLSTAATSSEAPDPRSRDGGVDDFPTIIGAAPPASMQPTLPPFDPLSELLGLWFDDLTIGLLAPSRPQLSNPITFLERLCIEGGELEFICRQRYGR